MVAIQNGVLGLSVPKLVEMAVIAEAGPAPILLLALAGRTAHNWDLIPSMKIAMMEDVQVNIHISKLDLKYEQETYSVERSFSLRNKSYANNVY